MKNYFYIFLFLFIVSCDSDDSGECFKTAGKIIQTELELDNFSQIVVHKHIELIIQQGDVQKVIIETGENLLSNISVEIINNELVLKNNTTCNFIREYDLTKVYVTSPKLDRIRNASELSVSSIGKLTYPSLYLMSVGDKDQFLSVGDWHLTIENQKLRIWSNGIANFYIKGATNDLDLNFSSGDTRFEGENFKANHITVKNISSNDLLVYPIESLKGEIYSTGDVISYNKPPIVEVTALTKFGKLIFN